MEIIPLNLPLLVQSQRISLQLSPIHLKQSISSEMALCITLYYKVLSVVEIKYQD